MLTILRGEVKNDQVNRGDDLESYFALLAKVGRNWDQGVGDAWHALTC